MREPKLKDSYRLHKNEHHPIGKLNEDIVRKIGEQIIYMIYIGRKDLCGDDWGDIYANAIGAKHLGSPLGLNDVIKDKCAWSMKTVKTTNPFTTKSVRLISGRCSPGYSYGIENPHDDIQRTGNAVLAIYNSRVQISYTDHNPVRTMVLVRDKKLQNFVIFETELHEYNLADYVWNENSNGNIIGIRKSDGVHCFSWQPHGSQFTIIDQVPDQTIKFKVKTPPKLSVEQALKTMNFDQSWITIG